jgi:hypothetical protein
MPLGDISGSPLLPIKPSTDASLEEIAQWSQLFTDAIVQMIRELQSIFNHGLTFDLNFVGAPVSIVTPGTPDTDFQIEHQLGRVPDKFIILSIDKAAIIYKSPTAWTDTLAYLRCNIATTAITILVM